MSVALTQPSVGVELGRLPAACDVCESLVIALDASAETTREALSRLDLAAPARRSLHALGLADRVVPLPPDAGRAVGDSLGLELRWRIEPDGAPEHLSLRWDFRVQGGGDGALLSVNTCVGATERRSHERLLDAWPLVGPLVHAVAQRAARTVKAYAEDELSG